MDNLTQLKKLAQIINVDKIISPQEIEDVLKAIIQILANNKKEILAVNTETKQQSTDLFNRVVDLSHQLQAQTDEKMGMSKSETDSKMSQMMAECKALIEQAKMAMPADGQDGKDADEENIVSDVLAKIKLPEAQILDDGEKIIGKINDLPIQSGLQIDAAHIKNLPKPQSVHNALFTLMDVDVSGVTVGQSLKWDGTRWIPFTPAGGANTPVYGEIPTGSGTSFTLAHTPAAGTLRVYALGQRLVVTTDYSLTSTTITTVGTWNTGDLQVDYEF